jgi:hypothetical protein
MNEKLFTPEQLDKINKFAFIEDVDENEGVYNPDSVFAENLQNCATVVYEWLCSTLSIGHYDQARNVFSLNVPVDLHPLLASIKNPEYSVYSNATVAEVVYNYIGWLIQDYKFDLQNKIINLFADNNLYGFENLKMPHRFIVDDQQDKEKLCISHVVLLEEPILSDIDNQPITSQGLVLEIALKDISVQ